MRPLPTLLACLATATLAAEDIGPSPIGGMIRPRPEPDIVAAVAAMPRDAAATALFRARGLDVLPLTWEDTGRWKESAVGPNISDLTIQLLDQPGPVPAHAWCMPVVRFANF
ncbi:MAG TPA: hypothetical protein VL172_21425, partial [Kofleriaceae bacterium]|nr:hypothetical protein [Kofleriaceae bacterium]